LYGRRVSLSFYLVLFCVGLLGSGCSEGGSSDEEVVGPDIGESESETETSTRNFELPPGWYPVAPDNMEEYGGLSDSDDLTEFNEPETLERLRENYEKCDVAVDESGLVRARCTEDVTWSFVNPCPRGRFRVTAQWPLNLPGSEWSYCLQDGFDYSIRNCRETDCTKGYVCEGSLRNLSDGAGEDGIAFCVDPERCLTVTDQMDDVPAGACFYDDLTIAETGEIAEQDCSSLESSECAINCPCAAGTGRCRFLSEEKPVGLCSSVICGDSDSKCVTLDQGVCMHLADTPAWLSDITPEDAEEDVQRGQCVSMEECEQLQARYPGDFRCGFGDD
jgi:hypothetical protein